MPPPSPPPPSPSLSPSSSPPTVYASCGSVLRESEFSSARLPSVQDGGGPYLIQPPTGGVLSVLCAFEGEGASAIAWTLFVTKSGGWASGWQQPGVAPAWGATLGKQLAAGSRAPSLVADYKLPLGAPSAAQEAELGGQGYVLLTLNSTRVARNRVVRALDRDRSWAFADASARRALDADKAAGSGATPPFLVFSQDGGVCLTAHAGASGRRFDCGGGGGVQDLLGLLDASASADFANCDTFGWKGNEAGTAPEVYLTTTCSAPDQSYSARCSRGGTCVNPTCCKDMFQSDQEKCGIRMCQPYCRLLTATVDLCGSSVEWLLTGGWVSVWFGSSRSV
jgi:hypothetical protein